MLGLFYVDDGSMPYTARNDMIDGTNITMNVFSKFGLVVHVGSKGKKSKTESVFFPSTHTLRRWREADKNNEITNFTHNDNSISSANEYSETVDFSPQHVRSPEKETFFS